MTTSTSSLPKRVVERATSLGFTEPKVVALSQYPDAPGHRLRDFVAEGRHGTMGWMEGTMPRRVRPEAMWDDARSAVVLGMNYGPEVDPLENLDHPERATISVYARNRDYHDVMKGRLKEVAGLIARDLDCDVKVFVDTAPLMEKPLAAAAGLGWQGKHTNLLSRKWGNWLFLGVILTNAELEGDAPEEDHCGSCRACLDICPTDAFPAPYQLDARRCISYLTIEHDGPIPLELREKMGNRIYGCDDCLAVCPWNKFAQATAEMKLAARDDLVSPKLNKLAVLTEAEFRTKFAGSPIKRIGHARFLRNVLYAIGNSHRSELLHSAQVHLEDTNPATRDAAQWACKKLVAKDVTD